MHILFQGDSISDGGRGRNLKDLNHIHGHGFIFSIASKLGSERFDLTFTNRGVSGNRAVDLYARWETDTLELNPDIISILVGTNDAYFNTNPDKYEKVFRLLIDETPSNIKWIICEPFTLNTGNLQDGWPAWRDKISEIQKRAKQVAADSGALWIPLQDAFDDAAKKCEAKHWIWDSIHPTTAGHHIITERWLEKASALF